MEAKVKKNPVRIRVPKYGGGMFCFLRENKCIGEENILKIYLQKFAGIKYLRIFDLLKEKRKNLKTKEIMKFNKKGQNVITRENEINVIAFKIQNSDDIILGRTNEKGWVVKTSDGIMIYSTNEMEEIYILDLIESDLERLNWTA